MKKIKYLVVLFVILLLSGCGGSKSNYDVNTINYILDISDTYMETIDFVLPADAYEIMHNPKEDAALNLEYLLLETNDQYPYFYSADITYEKKISKYKDRVDVSLKYNYIEDEFLYHNYIMMCFENYDIRSTSDYFEVNLSGEFACMHDMDKLNIFVNTDYVVKDTNGIKKENGYNWTIDKNNYKDVNIYYKLKRDYDDMLKEIPKEENVFLKNFKNILKLILIIGCIFLLVIFYKRKKKEQEV